MYTLTLPYNLRAFLQTWHNAEQYHKPIHNFSKTLVAYFVDVLYPFLGTGFVLLWFQWIILPGFKLLPDLLIVAWDLFGYLWHVLSLPSLMPGYYTILSKMGCNELSWHLFFVAEDLFSSTHLAVIPYRILHAVCFLDLSTLSCSIV